jgi:hypothetical protein
MKGKSRVHRDGCGGATAPEAPRARTRRTARYQAATARDAAGELTRSPATTRGAVVSSVGSRLPMPPRICAKSEYRCGRGPVEAAAAKTTV